MEILFDTSCELHQASLLHNDSHRIKVSLIGDQMLKLSHILRFGTSFELRHASLLPNDMNKPEASLAQDRILHVSCSFRFGISCCGNDKTFLVLKKLTGFGQQISNI